jgi:hypothetical protein
MPNNIVLMWSVSEVAILMFVVLVVVSCFARLLTQDFWISLEPIRSCSCPFDIVLAWTLSVLNPKAQKTVLVPIAWRVLSVRTYDVLKI